jgi:type I restriction enzyme, S subunit
MSPFDKARYERLLEGLEVTVIRLSQINNEPSGPRWDSEFFRKPILAAKELIESNPYDLLVNLTKRIQHPVEVERIYSETGLRILLAQEVRNNQLILGEGSFMSSSLREQLGANKLEREDVVLTRSGANFGQCAPVKTDEEIFACADLLIIRKGRFPGGYISTFLNTLQGRLLLDRGVYGMAQPHIAPTYIRTIPVPLFDNLIKQIDLLVEKSEANKLQANKYLAHAEQTLLEELGLANWTPREPLTYQRSSKDVFAAERFDAEYFNPAKQKVLDMLSNLPNKPLGERVKPIRSIFDPKKKHIPFETRNYDLPDALNPVLDDFKETCWSNEDGSTKKLFKEGDVVISRLRAYLREISIVNTSSNIQAMGSTEFIVLRPQINNEITAETLWTFLRSAPVQTVLKWCIDGSQHPRFSEDDLLNIPVPDVVVAASPKLGSVFQSAIIARRHAQELLDRAKRAVEIAIEDSEAAALDYLWQDI